MDKLISFRLEPEQNNTVMRFYLLLFSLLLSLCYGRADAVICSAKFLTFGRR